MPFSLTAKKLFSVLVTLVVVAIDVYAIHWLFVYYTESPWIRDGRIRANVYQVAPDVTGRIVEMAVSDNQNVSKGDLLLRLIRRPMWVIQVFYLGELLYRFRQRQHRLPALLQRDRGCEGELNGCSRMPWACRTPSVRNWGKAIAAAA